MDAVPVAPTTVAEIVTSAAAYGLQLDPVTVTVDESGLDFRVALARTEEGQRWVVRIARRPDAAQRAQIEAAVLEFLSPRLSVAVPHWRLRTPQWIAYPALPGEPGLTIDSEQQPVWRLDAGSMSYAESLGRLIADLHSVPLREAAGTGLPRYEPGELRQRWRRDIETVCAEFDVAEQLQQRWRSWLADDSYWPQWSVLTHGELYPAHVLIDADDRITGVLDWTTAEIGDPARDLAPQYALAPRAAFIRTVEAYRAAGGRVWPRLAEHCAQLWSTGPVGYALFALHTGEEPHRNAAQAELDARRSR